jgi:HEXXH motif-containing protein
LSPTTVSDWLDPGELQAAKDNRSVETHIHGAEELICRIWPDASIDVSAFFRGYVAIAGGHGCYSSGSSADHPLLMKLYVPPEPELPALAESIIHETSHIKLRCAMHLERFMDDDGEPRFHHPWRTDPRS